MDSKFNPIKETEEKAEELFQEEMKRLSEIGRRTYIKRERQEVLQKADIEDLVNELLYREGMEVYLVPENGQFEVKGDGTDYLPFEDFGSGPAAVIIVTVKELLEEGGLLY